jgi:hypothetical protein
MSFQAASSFFCGMSLKALFSISPQAESISVAPPAVISCSGPAVALNGIFVKRFFSKRVLGVLPHTATNVSNSFRDLMRLLHP